MNEQQNDRARVTEDELRAYIHDFFQVAVQYLLLLVVLVAAASVLLGLWTWRSYSPNYEATATFTVFVSNALQSEVRAYNTSTAEQMAKTFPYILTSGALQEIVRRELNITSFPGISASVLRNTNIFTLKVTSNDPQLSEDVLQVVMEYYPDIAEFVVGPTVLKLLDESGVSDKPVNPFHILPSVRRGALIGGVLWLLWCIFQTMLHSTVHNEDELKKLLGLRSLGVIPNVYGKGKNETLHLTMDRTFDNSGFSEALRLIRIRTEKELRERNIRTLMVCSAVAGEGKSTVSINLASALAAKGNRTLLIECDLRDPSVAAYLGRENSAGITELLKGRISPKEILRETSQDNLFVIFAGGPSSQAAELLSSPKLKELIDICRKNFDYIILDTSPVLLLSDVSELAGCADGALLTIRENYAAKHEVRESAQILADSNLPLIGCVLNRASFGTFGCYGKTYRYGSYGENSKQR